MAEKEKNIKIASSNPDKFLQRQSVHHLKMTKSVIHGLPV